MEKIILNQVSNPGISFTNDVNEKILALYDFSKQKINDSCTYQQFQEELINNNLFSGSYIRSFIPFLYNAGMINDYTNIINFNNLFTKNGVLYIKTIQSLKQASESQMNVSELLNIKKNLLCISLDFMIKNKYKFYSKYLDILKFVKEYKTINREEFYILEYCIQNNLNYREYIDLNRREKDYFDIYIRANNDEILSYRSNNAFNYFVAFLADEQCNYICKISHTDYQLNVDREIFLDSVLNEEKKEGGIYE